MEKVKLKKQLNDAFKDVKEPKKDEEEPAKLHIHIDEDSERNGYGCETEICGDVDSVLDMTAVAVATMANQISEATTLSPIRVIPEVMMRAAHFIMEDEKRRGGKIMARPKKVVEENNLKEIPLEDLALEEIEDLPAMPEIPVQEPSIEEQIKMATNELEKKNQDLTMALYNKEHEVDILKQQLQKQEEYYNNAIARLVLATYGG